MDVIVDQWNDAKNEVEEVVLQRKKGLQRRIDTIETDVEGGGLKQEINIITPASDSPILEDYTSLNIVRSEIGKVDITKENDEERQELYMERVFEIPSTHGFYCPNCKSCIQKVYIQRREWEQISIAIAEHNMEQNETLRCLSCFSFLIPLLGSWLFPGLAKGPDGVLNQQVPPLVYGFSFHENGDKDFKLAAVLGASLLCITLLSIAKAYTQKSNTFLKYFKTVIYYVCIGVVGSVLSYLAGDLVKKLLEKVAWLEPSSNFGLHVQGMSVQKTEWSSY
ncbi:hypothetical protein TanjilG_25319 [Lupinus angustifolius]|uniref:Uncharacterized protein n=1 Tax=Lupinus angustifolius TaxID=3871 RepID=A0A4P1RVP4_LUPAN|nr:hypothetical protein TanjilG_25319 [Lupinus angustifolius]